jgi:hypothetical protein
LNYASNFFCIGFSCFLVPPVLPIDDVYFILIKALLMPISIHPLTKLEIYSHKL